MSRTLRFTLISLFVVACGDNGGGDEITAIPFPTTIELSAEDLASLESAGDDGSLVFDPAPEALADVAVGRILVGGVSDETPAGLIRAVLRVERDGDRLTLGTAVAPIQLAYRVLHVKLDQRSAAVAGAMARRRAALPAEGFEVTKPFDFLLFDGDGDAETEDDQIHFEGDVGGGFDWELEVDVDWGDITELPDVVTSCLESLVDILEGELPSCSVDDLLPEAIVEFVVTPEVRADANVSGAAILAYEKEIDLASETLTPITVGPLVFVPVIDVTARLEGGASGQFSTGVQGSATFETSVVASTSNPNPTWSEPRLVDSDFEVKPTSVALTAFARVGVGARINVLLFGVTGPYATARAFGEVEASLTDDPCWALSAGVEANLGVKVTTPALPIIGQLTLVDWSSPTVTPLQIPLDEGNCDPPPDASELPPGAGPDADHLANPTYEPWARSWSSPVEGAHAGTPGLALAHSDLSRTIDGNLVRAGYGVLSLTKTSDDGELVWARDLELENGGPLRPLRARSTTDAGLLVVSQAVVAPLVLTELAQDGRVVSARAYDVPLDVCQVQVLGLEPDGARGWYLAGDCIGTGAFLFHERAGAGTLYVIPEGDLNALDINLLANVGGDAFLAGRLNDGGFDELVALRVTEGGDVVWAHRYQGCDEAPHAVATAAIVGEDEEITLAGNGIFRLNEDGTVGFASFPGFGFGAGHSFLLDSFVELPTTGYVAAGSTVQFTDEEPQNVPSAALLGLDATGKVIWSERYSFGEAGDYRASGRVGVRLSDDGGIVASAFVTDPDEPLRGDLWSWKPFAKDGTIDFSPASAATRSALGVGDLACTLTDDPLDVALDATSFTARAVTVTSTAVDLDEAAQTAD